VAAEIESITGHTAIGTDGQVSFVVTYSDGTVEHRKGTLLDVSKLASTAGLHLAHSSAGTYRWTGKPETFDSP